MNNEIKEILNRLNKIVPYADVPKELAYMITNITPQECKTILDYITNLQQENERLNRQLKHYWKYRNDTEQQKEVYDILELGKDLKNLHKHKNTGGLLWIDLPMTLFSSLTSYIRARDVMVEDYKSRIEKAIEYINGTTFFGLRSGKTFMSKYLNELLNILNGKE